jgi:hypothetical protein
VTRRKKPIKEIGFKFCVETDGDKAKGDAVAE